MKDEIIWCPHWEQRVYLEICRVKCPVSRRRRCVAFNTAGQLKFDFKPQPQPEADPPKPGDTSAFDLDD